METHKQSKPPMPKTVEGVSAAEEPSIVESLDPAHPLWQERVCQEQIRLAKARLEEVVSQLKERGTLVFGAQAQTRKTSISS